MSETKHEISVEKMITLSKRAVQNYSITMKHVPTMLRNSMMLAYQTAVDDMLMAMDASRVSTPIIHEDKSKVVLLDSNGHAT